MRAARGSHASDTPHVGPLSFIQSRSTTQHCSQKCSETAQWKPGAKQPQGGAGQWPPTSQASNLAQLCDFGVDVHHLKAHLTAHTTYFITKSNHLPVLMVHRVTTSLQNTNHRHCCRRHRHVSRTKAQRQSSVKGIFRISLKSPSVVSSRFTRSQLKVEKVCACARVCLPVSLSACLQACYISKTAKGFHEI